MAHTPHPDVVTRELREVEDVLCEKVIDAYRWMHDLGWSRRRGGERVGGRSQAELTEVESIAAHQRKTRAKVRRAAQLILVARQALVEALAELERAGRAADEREPATPSDHDVRIPRLVTKAELDAARLARIHRHSRGEGWGAA